MLAILEDIPEVLPYFNIPFEGGEWVGDGYEVKPRVVSPGHLDTGLIVLRLFSEGELITEASAYNLDEAARKLHVEFSLKQAEQSVKCMDNTLNVEPYMEALHVRFGVSVTPKGDGWHYSDRTDTLVGPFSSAEAAMIAGLEAQLNYLKGDACVSN